MIHESRIDLNVPYARKDEAKALGARWDGTRRLWYVPARTDLRGFDEAWFPTGLLNAVGTQPRAATATDGEPENGISLSELLGRIKGVLSQNLSDSVWVRAEISELSSKNGNVYLQLTERNGQGDPLGRAKGIIWKARAVGIASKFVEATGEGLRTDIKILCLVQVRFDALYGLDLIIEDVDPSYTLGDLAAKLARIRQRLIDERIYGRNQSLPAPVEFLRVAVISPETSAGLGDFRRETDRLQRAGLCDFAFFGATFQGLGVPASMRAAFDEAMASHDKTAFDALVIIRGGGSVTDLAWLNDLEVARMLCSSPIPVLTGIGHERDSTILDEVAHRRFDTPSKVALHIMSSIRDNAAEAMAAVERIKLQVGRILARERTAVETQAERIKTGAMTAVSRAEADRERAIVLIRTSTSYRLQQERAAVDAQATRLREGSSSIVRRASEDREEFMNLIRTSAGHQAREAALSLGAERGRLANLADQAACEAGSRLKGEIDAVVHRAQMWIGEQAALVEKTAGVLALRTESAIDAAGCDLENHLTQLRRESGRLAEKAADDLSAGLVEIEAGSAKMAEAARTMVEGHMRLVMGLGPNSTLRRGFAIARDRDGRPITSRADAAHAAGFGVHFHDGAVRVSNDEFQGGDQS